MPGAVTGVDLGAAGTAVLEAQERGERPAHDAVVPASLEVGDHGDTAGVVLELRDVKVRRALFSQGGPPVVSVHPDNSHRDDVMGTKYAE